MRLRAKKSVLDGKKRKKKVNTVYNNYVIAYHNNFPNRAFFETVDKPEKKIKFTGTPVEIIYLIFSTEVFK